MTIYLTIDGIIRGGKNNMIVLRNGMHIPKPEWKKWRDVVVSQIKKQVPDKFQPFAVPCGIYINYWEGDLRRRDIPAIIDSIFHCLERANIVTDDCLFKKLLFDPHGIDRDDPRAELQIFTLDA